MATAHPILPAEIWILIIKEIVRSENRSAYRQAPECTQGLAALCLVNHAFKEVAEPLLYSSPFITPGTLSSFSQAVAISSEKEFNTRSTKGQFVRSLAFFGFDIVPTTEQFMQITAALTAVRSNVVRLLFDINLTEVRSSLYPFHSDMYHALRSLERIEEFCMPPPNFDHDQDRHIPAWKTLKRFAVTGLFVDKNLLHELDETSELETCITASPPAFVHDIMCSLGRGDWTEKPREFVLVAQPMFDPTLNWLAHQLNRPNPHHQPQREAGRGVFQVIQPPGVSQPWSRREEQTWLTQAMIDGTIWGIRRQSLNDVVSSRAP